MKNYNVQVKTFKNRNPGKHFSTTDRAKGENSISLCNHFVISIIFFFFLNVTILFQGYCSNSKSNWIMQPIVKECSFSVKK